MADNGNAQQHNAVVVPFDVPVRSRLSVYEPFWALSLAGWEQQFTNYCASNLIPAEPVNDAGQHPQAHNQRRAVFLNHLGDHAYEVWRKACLPDIPSARSIPQFMQILRVKFENPGLVESNRRFHARNQRANESAADFVYALQDLAAVCDFGPEANSDMLKSRLIGGLSHGPTREKLLLETASFNVEQTKIASLQVEKSREFANKRGL